MEDKHAPIAKYVVAALVCVALISVQAIPWTAKSDAVAKTVVPVTGTEAITVTIELVLNGQSFGYFDGCSGLGSKSEIAERDLVRSTGTTEVAKMPDRIRWNDIVLSRGMASDTTGIWDWRNLVEQNRVDLAQRNGTLVMYDVSHNTLAQWNIVAAWPSAVYADGPIEKVVITHQGLSRVK